MTVPDEDEGTSQFFVRALFDFTGSDTSSLSFRAGDIIEVLNTLPSGWWDGLLDDERGWFPSNYVQQISDAEAEQELNLRDLARQQHEEALIAQQQQQLQQQQRAHAQGQAPAQAPGHYPANGNDGQYWEGHAPTNAYQSQSHGPQDYWMPEVTENGQISYINIHTGQRSRFLPVEDDHQIRDDGMISTNGNGVSHMNASVNPTAPMTMARSTNGQGRQRSDTTTSNASSSRVDPTGASAAHYVGSYGSSAVGGTNTVGFGAFHRSDTPEPWVKRLADDGMTYYYYNTQTEEARWTKPEASPPYPNHNAQRSVGQNSRAQQQPYNAYQQAPNQAHMGFRDDNPLMRARADSEASLSGREGAGRRASVYSDVSEVSPLGKDARSHHGITGKAGISLASPLGDDPNATNLGNIRQWPTPGQAADLPLNGNANPLQVAMALQSGVAAQPLPPLTVYSDRACEAIGAVVEAYADTGGAATNGTTGDGNPSNPSAPGSQTQPQPQAGTDPSRAPADTARIQTMADRVALVVVAVRNLLYVSGTLTGSMPHLGNSLTSNNSLGSNAQGGLTDEVDWVRQEIKPFQRKVTATLSKLVLSARAVNANPDWPTTGGMSAGRVESDAAELERAVTTFVYQIQRSSAAARAKRLHGVMLPGEGSAGIGPGLIGAGVGGNWNGAGFVPVGELGTGGPERRLGREVVSELATLRIATEEKIQALRSATEHYKAVLKSSQGPHYDPRAADLVIHAGRLLVAHISDFLLLAEDVHIASCVDVMGADDDEEAYLTGVKRARELIRTFETAKQALYDDGSVMLMASQAIHVSSVGKGSQSSTGAASSSPADLLLQTAIPAISSNLGTVMETLELLSDIAHEQIEVRSQREVVGGPLVDGEYPHHPAHYQRQYPNADPIPYMGAEDVLRTIGIPDGGEDGDHGDTISISDALGQPRIKAPGRYGPIDGDNGRLSIEGGLAPSTTTVRSGDTVKPLPSIAGSSTVVGAQSSASEDPNEDSDDSQFERKKQRSDKIAKIFGTEPPPQWQVKQKEATLPAYLRPDHTSPSEIVLNPDGAVRAGTLPALIERLTMHSGSDARFNDTFMMTFKSFATIDEVFDMLVERFNIQPPADLTSEQMAEWTRVKKTPIRLRSINTMRKLIDVLEKDDLHIVDRVKNFANSVLTNDPDMAAVGRSLLQIIGRVEKNGLDGKGKTMHTTTSDFPPPSILPRKPGKLKLLDIDPLELARQLTILESELFFKIKQSECIARSKESTPAGPDNIKSVITVTNKMADWVADAVLTKEDPRRRAAVIKHFVNVAERCRHLKNFSSMAALIAGLNCPPIRRLKRTWEQVNVRVTAVLDDLEKTLDMAHNFQGYKALLNKAQPPCVPFLGVYLTVLTFIQDGAKDTLKEGGLINFQKRQKTADVIQEITKFQMQPYNLTKLPAIRTFIEESLATLDNSPDFWQLSLEREPKEREDEKMARLLQESGFL